MIVRDAAPTLEECLESARAVVDEVVIADTGSVDDTLEIARRYADRLLRIPWTDNFSAARNATIDAATGEWILVLDADERLLLDRPQAFSEALLVDSALGYRLAIESDIGQAAPALEFVVRLFRRLPVLRYRRRVYESIDPALERLTSADTQQCVGYLAGVKVLHSGYSPPVYVGRQKLRRNLALLLLEYAESADQGVQRKIEQLAPRCEGGLDTLPECLAPENRDLARHALRRLTHL